MSYTALYRKFRPDNFDDVKGQDHIVTTLTNQIKRTVSVMPICFAEQGEPEKQQWQRFWQRQLTARIR